MAAGPVVFNEDAGRGSRGIFAGHAAWTLLVTGLIFLVGTLIDLFTLWVLQGGSGLQWEFVATTRTVEAFPRLILALAFFYVGLHLRGSGSLVLYRTLGASVLLLGTACVGLGFLIATNYLALIGGVNPEGLGPFRTTVFKSATLTALYLITLIPLGIAGLRKPRSAQ